MTDKGSNKQPKKRGRKKLVLNEERILALAAQACTVEEIAADQDCSADTLGRNFAEPIGRGKELAKLSIRAKQFQVAMGKPAEPAQYLRENVDANGNPFGKLITDAKGQPIKIRDAQPGWKPNVLMLIWLGKNLLNQSDKVMWSEGDGFEFEK